MKVMAITLPWVELLCALLLLANHWTESALLILAALMLAFTVATGQAWLRGLNITCGCFDLSLLGLGHRFEAFKQFWESVSVAFFRDLILLVIIYFLLRASIFKVEVSPTYCDSVNSES